MRVGPPTSRPISGRREDLRFPAALLGKSGIRGPVRKLYGGGLLDSGGAFAGVSVARFREGFRRKRGPETDHLRRPEGARIRGSPRPHVARFRADATICDFRRHRWRRPEIGISGSRQDVMGGVYWIPAARLLTSPSRVVQEIPVENGARMLTPCANRRGPAFESRPAHTSPDFEPDAAICDFRQQCRGRPGIGIPGSRQDVMGGSIGFRRRVLRRPRRAF